jgi:hypothetical protein
LNDLHPRGSFVDAAAYFNRLLDKKLDSIRRSQDTWKLPNLAAAHAKVTALEHHVDGI